ncbi:MAG: hypothetical protein J6Q82_04375 [Clostridia bacterium]|nr:hypothetical protein [Clostridia bacterium]
MRNFFILLALALLLSFPLLLLSCNLPECAHEEFESSEIAPTCEEQGYILWNCTKCDYSYQSDFTPSTEHTMRERVIDPTCIKEGYTLSACECGYSYKTDFTEPVDHSYEDTVVPPTCEQEGYRLHTCLTCEESYKTEIISASGHLPIAIDYTVTCTQAGYTEYSCENCDLIYHTDVTPPLGHQFATTFCLHPTLTEHGKLVEICLRCDSEFSNYLFYTDVYPGARVQNTEVLFRGVDVSVYQHRQNASGAYLPLNWTALKEAGMSFAILKAGSTPRTNDAGEPRGGIDPVFEMNYTDAKAAGFALGAYFYTYATTEEQLLSDIEVLLGWLDGKQFEYPIYFDLEDPSLASMDKETLTEFCLIFVNELRENGYYGALYSNNDWLVNRLDTAVIKSSMDIWYARYPENRKNNDDPVTVEVSYTWGTSYGDQLGMWQYTDYGVIDGIDGIKFDFNYTYKDYPSMIKKLCFNGFEPMEP